RHARGARRAPARPPSLGGGRRGPPPRPAGPSPAAAPPAYLAAFANRPPPLPAAPARTGPVVTSGVTVQLALSTDNNQSVILNAGQGADPLQTFTLTVTVGGTFEPTVVDVRQEREPRGTHLVYLGASGAETSAAVPAAGGEANSAQLALRGAQTGSFQNDFSLTASVGGEDKAVKSATVIQFDFSPGCVYLADGRPVTQGLLVTPAI